MIGVEIAYGVRLVLAFGLAVVVLGVLLLLASRLWRAGHVAARPLVAACALQGLEVVDVVAFPAAQSLAFQFLDVEVAALLGAGLHLLGLVVSAAKWGLLLVALGRLVARSVPPAGPSDPWGGAD